MTKMEYDKIEIKETLTVDSEDVVEEKTARTKKKKVVTSKKKHKKNLVERLVLGLIGPDGLPAIGDYLGREIVVPAVKNIIVDSITSGINMAMFGESGPRNTNRPNTVQPRQTTNYTNRYQPSPNMVQPSVVTHSTRKSRIDDYIIADRHEAAIVLDQLADQANEYGCVSIADYYDLLGEESGYSDHNYGWRAGDFARATILPTRGGYILKLPPVQVI